MLNRLNEVIWQKVSVVCSCYAKSSNFNFSNTLSAKLWVDAVTVLTHYPFSYIYEDNVNVIHVDTWVKTLKKNKIMIMISNS